MKRFFVILLTVFLSAVLFGCSESGIEKPETNLEFWICDKADNIDFSSFQERYGIMGGREYYGSGYIPSKNENGEQIDPEECVIYTVTSYPDYSSKAHHITRISITDPSVYIFGLTLNSSDEEIKSEMKNHEFVLKEYENSYGLIFQNGKISIHFTKECICISVEVTNKLHIQF